MNAKPEEVSRRAAEPQRLQCKEVKDIPTLPTPPREPESPARRVWIKGQGEFTLTEAKRKVGLSFSTVKARLDNGGGMCRDLEIYWADQIFGTKVST